MDVNKRKLIDSIKRHEGFSAKPYRCSQGFMTIGYGRNVESRGITESEAELLLYNDIESAVDSAVLLEYWHSLNEVRRRVIIEMIFNLGLPKFLEFSKMRLALLDHDYFKAADEMIDSLWAKQVGGRAKTLANMMRLGED